MGFKKKKKVIQKNLSFLYNYNPEKQSKWEGRWTSRLCTHVNSYEMQGPQCGCSKEMDVEINKSICQVHSRGRISWLPGETSTESHSSSPTVWLQRREAMTWMYPALRVDDWAHCEPTKKKNSLCIMCVRLLVLGIMSFESLCCRGIGVQGDSSLMSGTVGHK